MPGGEAFPALLSRELELPVINAGVDGDTTADALARIERDVLAHNPRIVIVEFGGNDFMKRKPKEETVRNVEQIVETIVSHGAMVMLLHLRTSPLRDPYVRDFRRIAETRGALLIENFMSGMLGDAGLTVDGIHPNAEGHALIAERVGEKLIPLMETAETRRAEALSQP